MVLDCLNSEYFPITSFFANRLEEIFHFTLPDHERRFCSLRGRAKCVIFISAPNVCTGIIVGIGFLISAPFVALQRGLWGPEQYTWENSLLARVTDIPVGAVVGVITGIAIIILNLLGLVFSPSISFRKEKPPATKTPATGEKQTLVQPATTTGRALRERLKRRSDTATRVENPPPVIQIQPSASQVNTDKQQPVVPTKSTDAVPNTAIKV